VRDLPGEEATLVRPEDGGVPPEAGHVQPVRHLGPERLVAIGLNSVIGGGIFVLPAHAAALVGSTSLPAYVATGLLVLGIGLVLGRLAARFETSGGPYLYIERAYGPIAGFQIGWLFWLARTSAMANLLNGVALYVGALWPAFAAPGPRAAVIAACAAAVIGLDIAGIRQAARATDLFAILKIAPLLVVGTAGLWLVEIPRLIPQAVDPGSFLRAVLLLVYAFTGFETLTVPVEESKEPRRDLPRALLATIGAVCGIYLLVHIAALGALADLATEKAPLATLAGLEFGTGGRLVITFLAGLSMAGCSLSSLLGGTRMLYAMSSNRRIPAWIGALHPGRRTPMRASFLTGGIAAIGAILGGYAFLAAISSGNRLLIYAACCLACLWTPKKAAKAVKPAGGLLLPAITLLTILVLLRALEPQEVLFGMIGIGAGWVLSILAGSGRRGMAREES